MGGNCLSLPKTMNSPVVINASVKHSATVFFLHGLGDTGHGWAPVFQQMRSKHIKFVCPTAPLMPVTINGGMVMPSWFDLKGLSASAPEDEVGIKAASKQIQSWMDDEIRSGIPSTRIMLGGFSQGGGLALYSGLTYKKPLAGLIAFSCWLPLHQGINDLISVNRDVPILQCHGRDDPLVMPSFGVMTAEHLKAVSNKHKFIFFEHMAHGSCEEELEQLKQYISEYLPQL